ncbi:hypothetical protein Glove_16g9 [Diversispora epigaea]|uniref:Uncharacterized protein n=1 Tax=Diversispora epigaea TaxID=1348612 RepID=A0A397JNN6_9GLOM|nr:hypothetical protein Glove_16g9 [Diversispora epigaea]
MKIVDLNEKYKQIDSYAQEKCAYKEAEKRGREMLFKKIGNIYEALQGDCINYEYFICGDPISEIWENLVKYIETIKRVELDIKKPKRIEILISPDIESSICSNFTKHINSVRKIAIKYNPFFHKLVYYMRYKEHIKNLDKIGSLETMRKKEIIKADRLILESFQKTWDESVNMFYASCEVKMC